MIIRMKSHKMRSNNVERVKISGKVMNFDNEPLEDALIVLRLASGWICDCPM